MLDLSPEATRPGPDGGWAPVDAVGGRSAVQVRVEERDDASPRILRGDLAEAHAGELADHDERRRSVVAGARVVVEEAVPRLAVWMVLVSLGALEER
jgi:hypothetical protein